MPFRYGGRKGADMKIDWVKKLTSRKLWLAIASFVSMLIVAFGGTENEATQVAAIIMAGATVIGYILGEGLTDAYNAKKTVFAIPAFEEDEEEEGGEDE